MPQFTPQQLTDIEVAFSTDVSKLMPKYDDIPREFRGSNNVWAEMVHTWFFSGLEDGKLKVKAGINRNQAIRHMSAILRSFEPKHEHKIAAVAYLMSQWFDLVGEKVNS